ncbi:MAG: hypothetical protein K1X71_13455, partial [Pirellulales bacterium]|nr:hypothetical protein [Pirellulales bacterium]
KQEHEDLKRKHQMALDDLRAQRAKIADLEKRGPAAAPAAAGANLDWEARKRMLLAALEADEAGETPLAGDDRRRIEEAIRGAEQIAAEKDREIAELQQLLDQQSGQIGGLAVGAAAIAQLVDNDAIILEEREKLSRLQAEWEGKLREAEVDLSVERARIARQRAEIEDKLREIQQHAADTHATTGTSSEPRPPSKPARGRWLARLGLKEEDEA